MNIEFHRPEFSLLFLVVGFLIYLTFRTHFFRKKYSQIIQASKTLEVSQTQKMPKNRIFKEFLFILGISLIVFSLMRPKWGAKHSIKKVVGSDLCIALDLSQSMLAEDMNPNRLEYAKRELILLLENLNKTKVTLVGFAGGAFIAAPLTSDLDAIADYLTPLDPSFVSLPSTFIQGAVITCAEALGYKDITDTKNDDEKENTAGSILLVTDGDDSNQIESRIIKGLVKNKIPISTFLIGKQRGTRIPQKDKDGHGLGFVKDPETGSEAKTKAEKSFVTKLAEKTNGQVYIADQSSNFKLVFAENLKKLEFKLKEEGVQVEKEEKFQIPLLIGIILLLIESMITETGGVFTFFRNKFSKHLTRTFLLLALFSQKALQASTILDSLQNNIGVFLFDLKKFDYSQEFFEKALNRESNEKKYIFNWITSRLKQIENKQLYLQTTEGLDLSPVEEEALEISKILEPLAKKDLDLLDKKKWLYQLAQAYELGKKTQLAIESYYNALHDPPSKTLDPKIRHNLARLLKQNSQKQGSGGGNQGQGKSNSQGNPNKSQDPNDENKKPQDYRGKNYTPDEVKQIMQSISSEERKVIKKKLKSESQKKGNDLGKQNGSSKPW